MLNGNFLESRLTFFDSEIVLANWKSMNTMTTRGERDALELRQLVSSYCDGRNDIWIHLIKQMLVLKKIIQVKDEYK